MYYSLIADLFTYKFKDLQEAILCCAARHSIIGVKYLHSDKHED